MIAKHNILYVIYVIGRIDRTINTSSKICLMVMFLVKNVEYYCNQNLLLIAYVVKIYLSIVNTNKWVRGKKFPNVVTNV